MTNRIPPSLNWLIDKRARVSGEIAKTKKLMKKAEALIHDLEILEQKLKAIDSTLDLHEIKIDVNLINPIRSHELRLNLPYGQLSKSILTCIRLYEVNGPVSKNIIEKFIVDRYFEFDGENIKSGKIKRILNRTLNNLYHRGYLVRHHAGDSREIGSWTTSAKFEIY